MRTREVAVDTTGDTAVATESTAGPHEDQAEEIGEEDTTSKHAIPRKTSREVAMKTPSSIQESLEATTSRREITARSRATSASVAMTRVRMMVEHLTTPPTINITKRAPTSQR